ncbi:DUF805 domain-containing protein [Novosphingobium resinovorum]|jgi:uncharacterized membrane protein YhaH (DUF805 family)|uniref:Putative membrane protein n=1 Tax=Novosphingobium resinovorum TaxID=158500 RepID=A0A031K6L7_9SPHN|nr:MULTISPECIES: DUF805 domain-containing protein [Novosphingobium]AOR75836.1 hypothetical protein BES08_03035 [Novosphingobium resinovorum]EZP84834.1 putative membrane protein [Novosphingobium resinovorum]MBF7011200.1 DUF805 domain-containing protein [Novosphingobium sp. HR1a]WJM29187.1 DUF805 domain-containing protein [Novosphingobium resinovorum]
MITYFRQAGRSVARSLDFRGKADRREFVTYILISQIPVAVLALATSWLDPSPVLRAVMLGVQVKVALPLFALSIRRFHDLGRSGWWSAPLLILVARMLLLELVSILAGWSVRSAIEAVLSYVDWLLTLPAVASFLAMVAWPSRSETTTAGTDRSVPAA